MALLEYEFKIIGDAAIDKAFASIERRAATHNARMNKTFGGGRASAATPAAARARAVDPVKQAAAAGVQAERQVAREKLKNERFLQNIKNRHFQQEDRERKKSWQQEERKAAKVAAGALRERKRVSNGLFGSVGRSAGGSLKAVGAIGAGALAVGGGFAVNSAIQTQMSEGAKASQLANSAGDPSIKGKLLQESRGVKGFTGDEALGGMQEFVTKTGDLKSARALIQDMGKISLATGTDLGELGATAGQAFTVLADSIEDPAKRLEEVRSLLGTLAQQGNMGAVEIKDLARDFGKLGAATRAFEGDAPDLLRTMGAFAQIAVARGGAEGSADASTAASRLAGDMVTHKDKFEAIIGKGNLKSKTDKTKLRDPMEIMLDVLDKTGGDIEKTNGLFGNESKKIFNGLSATYSANEKQKKGSGRAAVQSEFNDYAKAKLSKKDLNDRANSRLEDSDLQFKEAMKDFNTVLGTELLPTVTKLIPEFTKMLPSVQSLARLFAKFVDVLVDNPLKAIGAVIATKVALDIASARIGDRIKESLSSAMSGIKIDGKGINMSGAVFDGLSLGVTGALALYASGIVNFEKREASDEDLAKRRIELQGMTGDDPTALLKAKEAQKTAQRQQLEDNKPGMFESTLDTIAPLLFLPSLFDSDATKSAAHSAAQAAVQAPSDGQVGFVNSEADKIDKEVRRLEAETAKANADAAALQKKASEENLKAAQINAGKGGPNRGNTPSPVETG